MQASQQFLKLGSACREKLLFEHVSDVRKGKITAKFQSFKGYKRDHPKSSGTSYNGTLTHHTCGLVDPAC